MCLRCSRYGPGGSEVLGEVTRYPMTWLTGKPTRTRCISWAENDNDIKKVGTTARQDGRSILNNHLLHWISSTKYSAHADRTVVVYMADFSAHNEIVLERVAELDYSSHRVSLLHDDHTVSFVLNGRQSERVVLRFILMLSSTF